MRGGEFRAKGSGRAKRFYFCALRTAYGTGICEMPDVKDKNGFLARSLTPFHLLPTGIQVFACFVWTRRTPGTGHGEVDAAVGDIIAVGNNNV